MGKVVPFPDPVVMCGDKSDTAVARAIIFDKKDFICVKGRVFLYNSGLGIWEPQNRANIESLVQSYHGRIMVKNEEVILTNSRIVAVASCIQRETGIQNDSFFDDAPLGIACPSGFFGVEGEMRPHSPDNRQRFAFDLDPEWDTPEKTLEILEGVFEPDSDKAQKIAFLQQYFGVALLGQSAEYSKACILLGEGSNGKSVVLDMLSSVFGAAISHVSPQRWGEEYYLSLLAGSLLNTVGEIPRRSIEADDTFKSVISGDPVVAREPYGKPFFFSPFSGHVFSANALPTTRDVSEGFWRRVVIITFNRTFSGPGTKTTRQVSEMAGREKAQILGWLLQGARKVLETGAYTIPPSDKRATTVWQQDASQVARYWQARVAVSETPTKVGEIWDDYLIWCEHQRERPVTRHQFTRDFSRLAKKAGVESKSYRFGDGVGRGYLVALQGNPGL